MESAKSRWRVWSKTYLQKYRISGCYLIRMSDRLTIESGRPVWGDLWPDRTNIDFTEFEEVMEVIASVAGDPNKLMRTGGTKVREFEDRLAAFHVLKYGVSSSTGIAAVHLSILALSGIEGKLEPSSEVITAPITDPDTVMPLLLHNVVPVFADVDPLTLNITPESVEACIRWL
jgi:dTDP-4-amino-4,6-dideoxygalactose transaminase